MVIHVSGKFKVNDYKYNNKNLYIETNINPNFDLLRQSGTLIVNKEMQGLIKTAKYVTVAPKANDFLYIRNRAISAGNVIDHKDYVEEIPIDKMYQNFFHYSPIIRGPNDNGDFFSTDELKKSYKTFIGKAIFVDHDNDNIEKSRGIILDAIYNSNFHFVELLKAIDKKAYPKLARGIEAGYITSTSMGTRCAFSICSICGHKAYTEDEFCDHIKYYKGSTYNGLRVFEDNRDCEFFEDSFVLQGADPKARVLQRVAAKGVNKNEWRLNRTAIKIKNNYISNIKIYNEVNRRTYQGQVKSIFDQLNNLPWT